MLQPPELCHLPYVEDQTFGVEIELTSPLGSPDDTGLVYSNWKWRRVASLVLETIKSAATLPVDPMPRNYHEIVDTGRWRVEFDRSAGWEVVSPILSNREGFGELSCVLQALSDLVRRSPDLHVNHRTGVHITLGSNLETDQQLRGLLRLVQLLEPGLFTLVSPSRLYEFGATGYTLHRPNRYCRPLRELGSNVERIKLRPNSDGARVSRYKTVNVANVDRVDQHIEVRMHQGTTRHDVVVPWISLWMALFNRARFHTPDIGSSDAVFPDGNAAIPQAQARSEDIFALLEHLDIHLDPRLGSILRTRRAQLLEAWERVLPQRVRSWRAHWPVGSGDAVRPEARGDSRNDLAQTSQRSPPDGLGRVTTHIGTPRPTPTTLIRLGAYGAAERSRVTIARATPLSRHCLVLPNVWGGRHGGQYIMSWTFQSGAGPIVATAIHAGHHLRADARERMALDPLSRLREEDPYTEEWATLAHNSVVVHSSRFEFDLNRPLSKAVYLRPSDAWGLRVWNDIPPPDFLAASQARWLDFYAEMTDFLDSIHKRHGSFVVLDFHSYCHQRGGPTAPFASPHQNPDINIGTAGFAAERWNYLVADLMGNLKRVPFQGRHLDVRADVKFTGGHFSRWVNRRYGPSGCAVAVEIKKIFMDEWTGEVHHESLEWLKLAFASALQPMYAKLDTRRNAV